VGIPLSISKPALLSICTALRSPANGVNYMQFCHSIQNVFCISANNAYYEYCLFKSNACKGYDEPFLKNFMTCATVYDETLSVRLNSFLQRCFYEKSIIHQVKLV
jgi:hypothetical protein